MGITLKIKAMALALAVLLMALAAACGGDEDVDSSPKELVPQRANIVGTVAIDQLLELHAWQTKRVKEGIKAVDEGRFASDADMAKIFNKYENA